MSPENDIRNTLQKTPIFSQLKRSQLDKLSKRFVEKDYKDGDFLVTQDHGGEGFFVLVSGRAVARRTRSDGTQEEVNTFGCGDFFGELALLDDGPRTASVIAIEPTHCLVLSRWDFLNVLREDVDTAIAVLQEMARRFRIALDVF
ncbi:MAG: cyclic nucleotide-binding domain-containing protein [Anaerolineales bacterium]|nr:cyclic nucleotide-binding domain-containing protein [Anaerolineales bacterium]